MTAAPPRQAPAAADPFGARGPKLAALLGIAADARVLVAGTLPDGWRGDLPHYFSHLDSIPRLSALDPGAAYDAVLWAPGLDEAGDGFGDAVAAARAALAPGGTLLVFARNRFSLRGMAHHGAASAVTSRLRTPKGYRAALAGRFARVEELAAVPELDAAEEWVAPAALAPPSAGAERALHALGLLRGMVDGSLFLASDAEGGTGPLLAVVARQCGCAPLELERMALRERGALVLVARPRGGRRVACRVAAAGEAARLVGRNAEAARRLHADPAVHEWVRARIPRSLAEFPLGDAVVFAEEGAEGVMGWQLGGGARKALLAELVRFACTLAQDTSRTAMLDADGLEALLPDRLSAFAGAGLARAYAEVHHALARRVEDAPRVLAYAHGDFGPGNALADPRSGRLAAVIDWDQAGEDAAGVDLLNLAVQARRIERGEGAPQAFGHVAREFVRDGFGAVGAAELDAWLRPGTAPRVELAVWTALRMVLRSARYPALSAASADVSTAILAAAGRLLADVPAPAPVEAGA